MIAGQDIFLLAEDEGAGSTMRIVFFVLVALGWLVSVWLKKTSEQRAKAQAEQKARERRESREVLRSSAEQDEDDDWRVVSPPLRREEPQPVPMRQFVRPRPAPPPAPSPDHKPVENIAQPKKALHDQMRLRRGAGKKTADAAPEKKKIRVALDQPKTAQAAILFHEILSPPKALRDEPELWT